MEIGSNDSTRGRLLVTVRVNSRRMRAHDIKIKQIEHVMGTRGVRITGLVEDPDSIWQMMTRCPVVRSTEGTPPTVNPQLTSSW